MKPADLERALRDLPSIGTLLKVRPYRQIWRFELGGKPYYLKFYPRNEGRWKRLFRGSSALREFLNLQAMQRAGVPSPRAVAQLTGFTVNGVKGDAVILEGIEPSVQLDQHLNALALRGERPRDHRDLADQVVDIVSKLGRAKLGHNDLHLGNFLLSDGKLVLLDGYAVHAGGMTTNDILLLGYSVMRFATTADLVRGWRQFSSAPMPAKNPVRKRLWRKVIEQSFGDNTYFGKLADAEWSGHFFKHNKLPRRWSESSRHDVAREDWQREWPKLLDAIDQDKLDVIKRSGSGDVLSGTVTLGGRDVPVIVKRPKRRLLRRYVTEIGRGSRPRRAWKKAWSLVARDIPTAWPMMFMERRKVGYATDALIVFERVQGTLLSEFDLNCLDAEDRQTLFRRLGRTLRLLESRGLSQYDSKMTNWIVQRDNKLGPVPIMIDVDGIRRIVPDMWPIDRLLRSMREHKQYTRADSKELCLGYAPRADLLVDPSDGASSPERREDGGEGSGAWT